MVFFFFFETALWVVRFHLQESSFCIIGEYPDVFCKAREAHDAPSLFFHTSSKPDQGVGGATSMSSRSEGK